ncbi:hypothetical protein [Aureimonas mangrovi]|uniref:hypothetical protein n=1 Tax=Aureimonas mangrovi TaxID=2758041 RepID=UPI00163DD87E|nr:hypothetical protein [Aureimonas mangrovi]
MKLALIAAAVSLLAVVSAASAQEMRIRMQDKLPIVYVYHQPFPYVLAAGI